MRLGALIALLLSVQSYLLTHSVEHLLSEEEFCGFCLRLSTTEESLPFGQPEIGGVYTRLQYAIHAWTVLPVLRSGQSSRDPPAYR